MPRSRLRDEIANSTHHPDGYVCQNCGVVTDRLTLVPEFDYMGCDECMEEALKADRSRGGSEARPDRERAG
jgi:hypothetical protein